MTPNPMNSHPDQLPRMQALSQWHRDIAAGFRHAGFDAPIDRASDLPPTDSLDVLREVAIEQFLADTESYAGWLQCARGDREPSTYFGQISNAELLRMQLSAKATTDQLAAACHLLRGRYLLEHSVEIARRILELQSEE